MSELIDNIERSRKYKLAIDARGGWYAGVIRFNRYGYRITIHGVTLNSAKTYKHYDGAKIAAKKLIDKLENKQA